MIKEYYQRRISHLWNLPDGAVAGVLFGKLPSMKNQRRIVTMKIKGKVVPRLIKSKEALEYETLVQAAKDFVGPRLTGLPMEGVLEINALVFYENLRPDLDMELLCDCLQRAGVVKNDRHFWVKHCERRIDKKNPRVHFRITEIEKP